MEFTYILGSNQEEILDPQAIKIIYKPEMANARENQEVQLFSSHLRWN
jgi:hypothetical protein